MIKDYQVVKGSDVQTLTGKVTEAMKDGWEPAGGITAAQEGIFLNLYQTMVRSDSDKPKTKLVKRG